MKSKTTKKHERKGWVKIQKKEYDKLMKSQILVDDIFENGRIVCDIDGKILSEGFMVDSFYARKLFPSEYEIGLSKAKTKQL